MADWPENNKRTWSGWEKMNHFEKQKNGEKRRQTLNVLHQSVRYPCCHYPVEEDI